MKKITETLKRKWPEYLLEIMAIIIGIIGAFMLDSWRDERLTLQLEKESYSKMIADLKQDSTDLEVYLENATSHQDIHYQIYHELKGDSLFREDFIYDYIIFPIFKTSRFEDNHKGKVEEIKDQEVLDQVRRYFRSQDRLNTALDNYHQIQSDLSTIFMNKGVYDIRNTFVQPGFYNFTAEDPILDHERIMALKDNDTFLGMLSHLRMWTEYLIGRTSTQLQYNEELITFLEKKISE